MSKYVILGFIMFESIYRQGIPSKLLIFPSYNAYLRPLGLTLRKENFKILKTSIINYAILLHRILEVQCLVWGRIPLSIHIWHPPINVLTCLFDQRISTSNPMWKAESCRCVCRPYMLSHVFNNQWDQDTILPWHCLCKNVTNRWIYIYILI